MMFKNMTASDYAAWWGAIIATLVFGWEIYKWATSGPKVKLDIGTNMKCFGPVKDNKTYISIRVANTGDQQTTLTNLGFVHYKNIIQFLRNKPQQSYVVPMPITPHPIPHELRPGAIWDGNIVQNDEIEALGTNGKVSIHLYHSHSNKPVKKLVRFNKKKEAA